MAAFKFKVKTVLDGVGTKYFGNFCQQNYENTQNYAYKKMGTMPVLQTFTVTSTYPKIYFS